MVSRRTNVYLVNGALKGKTGKRLTDIWNTNELNKCGNQVKKSLHDLLKGHYCHVVVIISFAFMLLKIKYLQNTLIFTFYIC